MLARAQSAGVSRIIIPATDAATAHEALALAGMHPGAIFAAVGLHPNSTADFSRAVLEPLHELALSAHCVAIGEIGLDYHWDRSPKADQWAALEAQLELAAALNLPVILHNRESSADLISIIERWAAGLNGPLAQRPGVLHSFSAPGEFAERALAAGFMLGFTGPVTYRNADALRAVAAAVPLDRLLIETDSPFLSPLPHRGQRNEPAYVRLVAERLAALRDLPLEALAEATRVNAERLFALPPR